jgi:hypothetical protein
MNDVLMVEDEAAEDAEWTAEHAHVGKRLTRIFRGIAADGTVTHYLPPSQEDPALWHVLYDDGDEEDLDEEEINAARLKGDATASFLSDQGSVPVVGASQRETRSRLDLSKVAMVDLDLLLSGCGSGTDDEDGDAEKSGGNAGTKRPRSSARRHGGLRSSKPRSTGEFGTMEIFIVRSPAPGKLVATCCSNHRTPHAAPPPPHTHTHTHTPYARASVCNAAMPPTYGTGVGCTTQPTLSPHKTGAWDSLRGASSLMSRTHRSSGTYIWAHA